MIETNNITFFSKENILFERKYHHIKDIEIKVNVDDDSRMLAQLTCIIGKALYEIVVHKSVWCNDNNYIWIIYRSNGTRVATFSDIFTENKRPTISNNMRPTEKTLIEHLAYLQFKMLIANALDKGI